MEIDRKIFEKYNKFDINNIPVIEDNFINELVKQQVKDIDNMYCEFLEENGYKIDKLYNMKQIEEIRKDLEKQDTFVDIIEWIENKSDKDNYTIVRHIIPFFNCISNPLSEKTRNEIIEKWKENNRKDK